MLKLTPAGGLSACEAGDLAAARALAAAGWQAAHAVDKHGNTALMWAAGSGRLEVVRWLLEEEGVAVRPACRRRRLGVPLLSTRPHGAASAGSGLCEARGVSR